MPRDRSILIAECLLLFAAVPLLFLNPVAPVLSLLAGWLLARTWQRTHSLRAVCREHALYGRLVFTVGLGWCFYHGSVSLAQPALP